MTVEQRAAKLAELQAKLAQAVAIDTSHPDEKEEREAAERGEKRENKKRY